MILYAIPGMYELSSVNLTLLDLLRSHREYFYDDIDVEIIYGNPQFCIWDGGRIFKEYLHGTQETIRDTINQYNYNFQKPVRFVFTNADLKEQHFSDRFCNMLMELGNNYNNEVVTANDNLRDYLANKYKNYKFVSSTTKCLTKKSELLDELHKDEYKLVCLDYNFNSNLDFLNSLTPEEKAKSELLINPICPPGCKHRKEHYHLNSLFSLNYGQRYHMQHCSIPVDGMFASTGNEHLLTYQMLHDIYAPMGFTHFKIEGRTWTQREAVITYVNYMVKPEYHDYVINLILSLV